MNIRLFITDCLFDSISQFFFCICILFLFSLLPTFSVVNISEVPAQNLGKQVCLAMSLFATTPISSAILHLNICSVSAIAVVVTLRLNVSFYIIS